MHTWVYGKVEPGWYMAKWEWDENWAEDLKNQGYIVADTPLHADVLKVLLMN